MILASTFTLTCFAQEYDSDNYRVQTNTLNYNDLIVAEFPVIIGKTDFSQTVLDQINEKFSTEAKNVLTENIDDINEAYQNSPYASYTVTCDSIYIEGNIYSVKQTYSYYFGGAHPYSFVVASSFDLNTGEKLSMGNLLYCDEKTAKDAVVEAYRRDVVSQIPEVTVDKIKGALNEMSYWLTPEGMHANLDAYVVASYAAGPQHVIVTQALVNEVQNGTVSGTSETITVINGIQADVADFIFPYSGVNYLSDADLVKLNADTVEERHYKSQLAINEMLARYGYPFRPEYGGSTKEAYDQFHGKTWYETARSYCPASSWEDMLYNYCNDVERYNVDVICQWQQQNGCYY